MKQDLNALQADPYRMFPCFASDCFDNHPKYSETPSKTTIHQHKDIRFTQAPRKTPRKTTKKPLEAAKPAVQAETGILAEAIGGQSNTSAIRGQSRQLGCDRCDAEILEYLPAPPVRGCLCWLDFLYIKWIISLKPSKKLKTPIELGGSWYSFVYLLEAIDHCHTLKVFFVLKSPGFLFQAKCKGQF